MSIMSNIDSEGKKSNININGSFIRKDHNQSKNNQSKRKLATKCISER